MCRFFSAIGLFGSYGGRVSSILAVGFSFPSSWIFCTALGRAERRKKWPTEKNVAQKHQDLQARVDAGDVVVDQQQQQKPTKKVNRYCINYVKDKCELGGDECPYAHEVAHIRCRQFYRNGKCPRGDKCKFSHQETKRKAQGQPDDAPKQAKKPTSGLLQRLLQNDVEQEQRDILQAFRYLVAHSFFEKTQ